MVVSEFESQWGHSAPRDGDGSDEGGDGGYDDEHAMKMFRQSAYCIDLSTHMPQPPCHLSKPELLTLTHASFVETTHAPDRDDTCGGSCELWAS